MGRHVALLILVTFIWLSSKARAAPLQQHGYFWHVTDFHLDVNYSSSGNAKQMCWQPANENASLPGGSFGDYQCDSPYRLVESAMKAMKQFGDTPDFILWTGDDKAHVSDTFFSEDMVFDLISNLTGSIEQTFPNIPVIPVLGNHDWFPTHQLPASNDDLYNRIADRWQPWLGERGNETFRKGGYYVVNVTASNITFLVLNTALYYQKNRRVTENTTDPGGQFEWMEKQLQDARKSNRKVFVTSHVPPGVFERHFDPDGWTWLKESYNARYVDLIVEYYDVIIGQFFAHHHTDSFRIFYDEAGTPVNWILVAPAVTPWNTTLSGVGPNNPGLRKFIYSTSNHMIETFQQYYLNLSLANEKDNDAWGLEYDAKEVYDLRDGITPKSLHALISRFNHTDRLTFNRYYFFNSVSYQSASNCNDSCWQYHICAITNVNFDSFRQCYNNNWDYNTVDSSANFLDFATNVAFFFATVAVAGVNNFNLIL